MSVDAPVRLGGWETSLRLAREDDQVLVGAGLRAPGGDLVDRCAPLLLAGRTGVPSATGSRPV